MSSQTYAVDSDVLIFLQRARLESEFAKLGRLPIVVTAIVWDEVVRKPNRPNSVADLEKMLRVTAGEPADFEPDSPEAAVFAHLQQAPPTEGVGEHSVIAHVATHEEAIAVMLDKRAVHRAVEEIPTRVISVHGFIGRLLSSGHLPRELARQVSQEFCTRYVPSRVPHWLRPGLATS